MRTFALIAASTAALALAACSKEPEAPAVQESEAAGGEMSEAAVEPMASETATPEATATPVPQDRIPEKMVGRWGLVPLDCTSKLGDAKGLMTVSAQDIKFYESVAKLGKITGATDTHMRGAFSFSGEGQTWTQDVVLSLKDDKTLIRRDYGPDAMPGPLEYSRCQ